MLNRSEPFQQTIINASTTIDQTVKDLTKEKERGKTYPNSSLMKRFFRYASASWRTDGYGPPRFVSPHPPLPSPPPPNPFFRTLVSFPSSYSLGGNEKFRLSSSKLKMIK